MPFLPEGSPLPSILRHLARLRIVGIVERRPGITAKQMSRALGLTPTTLAYHLARLEECRLLTSYKVGRNRHYFPFGSQALDIDQVSLLVETTARRIAVYIVAHPGCGLDDIRYSLDLSVRVVYDHLKRMHDAGLIQSLGRMRYDRLQPTSALIVAIVPR